ncbi:carbohydrate ABC transporter permease [Vibrio alginolyticus]
MQQFLMSLQKFGLAQQFGKEPEWVGLANYGKILTDPNMSVVFFRSVLFCAVCALLSMAIGMLIALLLTKVSSWARIALQVTLLLVWATPALVTMVIWQWLFDAQVRTRQLGPCAHRIPRHGRLPVDVHADGCLHNRCHHRDLGQPAPDRVHDLLCPDAGAHPRC